MIENYLKILKLSGYKNSPSKLTDTIVLKNYKELVLQLDKFREKATTQEEKNQLLKRGSLLIEAYKQLCSEEKREKYFEALQLEEKQKENILEQTQEKFNEKIYTEEDFERIIEYARDQTKKIEAEHKIQHVPIVSGKNGKAVFGKVIREEKREKEVDKDDRERA